MFFFPSFHGPCVGDANHRDTLFISSGEAQGHQLQHATRKESSNWSLCEHEAVDSVATGSVLGQFDGCYVCVEWGCSTLPKVLYPDSWQSVLWAWNAKSISSSAAWISSRGTHCEFLTGLETVRRCSSGGLACALADGCMESRKAQTGLLEKWLQEVLEGEKRTGVTEG